jgi:hypothetical protein
MCIPSPRLEEGMNADVYTWECYTRTQMTQPMLDGQSSVVLSLDMPHYACVNTADKIYHPNGESVGGTKCLAGSDCTECKGLCTAFDFGGNAKVIFLSRQRD